MTAPFKIVILMKRAANGETVAEMDCTMDREKMVEYLIAHEKEGFAVPSADAASVLAFFIVSFLQDSCPCPGCLMNGTRLNSKRAKKAINDLADLGYIVGATEESLH